MACEEFRLLVQQKFDSELEESDDQRLAQHLKQCDSCDRFQFQISQIIKKAVELDLPDEATPENLESLARIIIQQLPKVKKGPFAMFSNLFGSKKGQDKKIKEKKVKEPKVTAEPQTQSKSHFPHVRRSQPASVDAADQRQSMS